MSSLVAILVVVLFLMVLNLRSRVKKLEEREEANVQHQAAPMQPQSTPSDVSYQPSSPLVTPDKSDPTASDRFGAWLKEDWLLKLGSLLLLIGFGWLVSYAFINNWIGPSGRIALGLGAGVLIMILGWLRIKTFLHQGSIFMVVGSTIILLTMFAAREIYGFFTPLSALLIMFASTVLVALASVRYKSAGLALSGLILAGIAPLLTDPPTADYVTLFGYLFIVTLGTLWVVAMTRHHELTTAALLMVVFYSIPHWFFDLSEDVNILLLFAYAFSLVFFAASTFGILRSKGKTIVADIMSAAGSGLFLLVWLLAVDQSDLKSVIIFAWGVAFAAAGFLIYRMTERKEPIYAYLGVAIAMFAAATAVEFEGSALVIAYTVETAAFVLASYFILRDTHVAERLSILFAGPILLSLPSFTLSEWGDTIFNEHFFELLVLAVALLGLGLFFHREARMDATQEKSKLHVALLAAGSIYAYGLLWLSLHAAFIDDDMAVMIALIVYTIIGLGTYFYGRTQEAKVPKTYGALLLGVVVIRLLVVDVWDMELVGRIVTFLVIGALLMSTAFLGCGKKEDESNAKEDI